MLCRLNIVGLGQAYDDRVMGCTTILMILNKFYYGVMIQRNCLFTTVDKCIKAHLASGLLVEIKELSQLVLTGRAGFINLVPEDQHGAVAQRLVS